MPSLPLITSAPSPVVMLSSPGPASMFIGIVTPGAVVELVVAREGRERQLLGRAMSTVNGAFVRSKRVRPAPGAVTFIWSSAVPSVISVSSTPSPPLLVSLPSPLFQIITSLPSPPTIVSSPRKPVMRSLPSPPSMASTWRRADDDVVAVAAVDRGAGDVRRREVDVVVAAAGVERRRWRRWTGASGRPDRVEVGGARKAADGAEVVREQPGGVDADRDVLAGGVAGERQDVVP